MALPEAVSSLGNSITSPAKIAFVAYVVLAYRGQLATSNWEFFLVVGIFVLVQVVHDDYLRILLNRLAERHAQRQERASRAAGVGL